MSDYPPPPPLDVPMSSDQLAGFGQRAIAYAIDSLIVVAVMLIFALAFGGDLTDPDNPRFMLITVLTLAVSLIYSIVFVALSGATPGKRIMKLRVVNRSDGSPVSWTYAAVRALIPSVAGLVPVIGFALNIAVYVRAFFHPYRQGLHDAAAGTIVVRR